MFLQNERDFKKRELEKINPSSHSEYGYQDIAQCVSGNLLNEQVAMATDSSQCDNVSKLNQNTKMNVVNDVCVPTKSPTAVGVGQDKLLGHDEQDIKLTPLPTKIEQVTQGSEIEGICRPLYELERKSDESVSHLVEARKIFDDVIESGVYNFQKSRIRIPSGLNIPAWREYLESYQDNQIVDYLEFGWPVSFDRARPLTSTVKSHPSGKQHPESVNHYIKTELSHRALLGPFDGEPVQPIHLSPLMSRPKKDSDMRRIVLDLSWPDGFSVNDGIGKDIYLDQPYSVKLPTIDKMEKRILELGPGSYLYKTDLSRGYRQLRVDPFDWPLLGFCYDGLYYMDICPPFGLRSAAMMMQRTSQAVSYIHGNESYPYIDDFGGGEQDEDLAKSALGLLQGILDQLGLVEAKHKVCEPSQIMVWLGILFNTIDMTMSIPKEKLTDIMADLELWKNKTHASRREMQSIIGSLQFVAKVAPPARLFISRMLECLRDTPNTGSHTLSLGFKKDVVFFLKLLPEINGVKILDKTLLVSTQQIELDACLTGCGAWCDTGFYGRQFPKEILECKHNIARLELLNLVVAAKLWAKVWAGHRVDIRSDNTNSCIVVMRGKSSDPFMQDCARELFMISATHDIELNMIHTPGLQLELADALSREHLSEKYAYKVRNNRFLMNAERQFPTDELFQIVNAM